MKPRSFLVILAVFLVNALLWEETNKPVNPSESGYPLKSISLNPYQRHQDPFGEHFPSAEEMSRDIDILSNKTKSIRLYSSTSGFDQIAAFGKKYGLKIIAGAWLDPRPEQNRNELEAVIKMSGQYKNVSHVIIGNETQLHGTVSKANLVEYLKEARKRIKAPVSTAEPWDYWVEHPELAEHVDFIAIHILPYWVDVPIDQAVEYVIARYKAVRQAFPKKEILIAETGWPSEGKQRGPAEPSITNQAKFTRDFVKVATAEKVNYNIIEAFDQPWKNTTEGQVGAHWGLMDADRNPKFALSGPVLEDPLWRYWALSSMTTGFLAMTLFLSRRRNLKLRGQLFSAVILQASASAITQLAREASGQYMSPTDISFWTIMCSAQALLSIILLTDAAEIADVVGNKPLKRKFLPSPRLKDEEYPFVSVHLACCKEPPEMVIATINSLSELDYPHYEVIVVDNNTLDPNLWQPVAERCAELGSRFRFYTLGVWPGFKAGALNFALRNTDPKAEVIGVVDADYIVEKNWLSASVPHFSDSEIAVVQAPQEHREWEGNTFKTMENDEYSGFFRIGMVQRNEDDAIIQHGTMTLIRKSTLSQLGGWAEWCICEDAELGLRILAIGKKTAYIDHIFGRGLVPDSYEAYAKQRFRWAYGGMRIMRRHWRELFLGYGKLTWAQRYQFIKGWLPWVGDALHMLFTIAALFWSLVLIFNAKYADFPAAIFVYPALALVLLRILGTAWTYSTRVKIGPRRTLLAMVAGGALTHTVAKAVFQGLFTSARPFYRTPKMADGLPFIKSILTAGEELGFATALIYCAYKILSTAEFINTDIALWGIALCTQSLPYLASVFASVISSTEAKASKSLSLVSTQNDESGISAKAA